MLKRTPFYDFHVSAGAKMVEFSGWEMPLLYRSIVDEHQQTRTSGSMFDVAHMGRFGFSGKDVVAFLNKVLTRNVAEQRVGQSRYSLICNPSGGVMDDVIVSRDEKNWVMVVNAGNREKIWAHLASVRQAAAFDLDIVDNTDATAMVAVQGPKVIERLSEILPVDLKNMKRYRFETTSFMLIKFTVFRSGYTGEDGVELILPAKMAGMAMKMLGGKMDKEHATIKPAGLGARDTLRIEAAMPLYGHELSETIDPISAQLEFAVDLAKDFIGAEALRKVKTDGPKQKRVGLELDGKRIARQGADLLHDGKVVGQVTSGTFSPTLQKSIAMAYVDSEWATEGTDLSADLKTTHVSAKIVKIPFYKAGVHQ